MLDKLRLAGRKFSEAWTSCLLCMVQGDLSVLTVQHAMIAGKTGIYTATAVFILSFSKKFPNNQYILAWLTGIITMFADMISHPSHIIENLCTGLGAGLLALILSKLSKKG